MSGGILGESLQIPIETGAKMLFSEYIVLYEK